MPHECMRTYAYTYRTAVLHVQYAAEMYRRLYPPGGLAVALWSFAEMFHQRCRVDRAMRLHRMTSAAYYVIVGIPREASMLYRYESSTMKIDPFSVELDSVQSVGVHRVRGHNSYTGVSGRHSRKTRIQDVSACLAQAAPVCGKQMLCLCESH